MSGDKPPINWPGVLVNLQEYQRTIGDAMLRDFHYHLLNFPELNYPNTRQAQKQLSYWTIKWRDSGELDYTKFIDTQREIYNRYGLFRRTVDGAVQGAIDGIKEASENHWITRQEGQPCRIMMLCEKEGRSRHLQNISSRFSVPLVSSKGYSSYTVLRKDLNDIFEEVPEGTPVRILALTDFDPSGENMVPDLERRLGEFYKEHEIVVEKVCITLEQIQYYNLPGQPIKEKDSRKHAFREKHGEDQEVVELNALPVPEFQRIVEQAVLARIDMNILGQVLKKEKEERKEIDKRIAEWLENRNSVREDEKEDEE